MKSYRSAQRGLTFIEMLVVLAIFVVIIGALSASVRFFYRANTHALEQSFAINSARKGIEQMVRDVREASFSDEGSYPVISMSTSTFSFYSDVDSDIFIEKVRYFLDGTELKRGITNSSGDPLTYDDDDELVSVISDNVRNNTESVVLFSFYNASGTPIVSTASTTAVRYVVSDLVINVNPLRLPNDFTLRSSATLRNVRDN